MAFSLNFMRISVIVLAIIRILFGIIAILYFALGALRDIGTHSSDEDEDTNIDTILFVLFIISWFLTTSTILSFICFRSSFQSNRSSRNCMFILCSLGILISLIEITILLIHNIKTFDIIFSVVPIMDAIILGMLFTIVEHSLNQNCKKVDNKIPNPKKLSIEMTSIVEHV